MYRLIPLVSFSNFMLDSLCLLFPEKYRGLCGTWFFGLELQVPMRVLDASASVPD